MSTRPNRETAYRVFAAEFDDASLSYAESDEERAPNYVVTPTGARLNRLFAVGVLTEIESVNEEQLRARVVDPTGAFVVYAGQYQPEALSALERIGTPAFVAVTGKARTFQPDDSNRVFTSIRPENLSEVDAATRDRFAVETAKLTLERVRTMRDALARDERGDVLGEALEAEGVEAGLAAGIPRALEHYGTTPAYLDAIEGMALDAARVVAGEREEVRALDVAPDKGSTGPAEPVDERAGDEPQSADATEESETETAVETGRAVVSGDGESVVETEPTDDSPVDTQAEPSDKTDSTLETGDSEPTETAVEPSQSDAEAGESVEDSFDESAEPNEEGAAEGDEEAAEADLDDPEEFELDADERERIEEEFGTDFESASEVDGPGEADIETPVPDDATDPDDETESTASDAGTTDAGETVGTEATDDAEPTAATEDTDDEFDEDTESAADDAAGEAATTDPEEAVVAAMAALDDGDGVAREAVVGHVVEEHDLTREQATDGIQSALMSGECYEPDDDTLKPI
ncbi:hypothetical protein [Halococcus sediminicola]|uniref:hypothetical protein n=1 Tax=Halococcus sediminicola TaxID=1264579 RepID=UPI0006785FF7|nr:hypothetical protein [Halococcus sediminicola]